MVFANAMTKAARLVELQLMFSRHPERAFSTKEIAKRLGIAPRTVRNYVNELSASGRLPVLYQQGAWILVPGARMEIPPVRFLLEEAAAVYLAARLLCRHADDSNPAVRGAVSKLAAVVPPDLQAAMDILGDRLEPTSNSRFAEVFRAVAYGWALRRAVDIEYTPRTGSGLSACRLQPYLLEPSAIGSAIYSIGWAEPPGAMRVFKLERVSRATLTDVEFEEHNPAALLDRIARAWGVWLTESEAVAVDLRFSPALAGRVAETRWHPSQRLTPCEDGSLRMSVVVSSTVEFIPWILGWGAACEVLGPPDLRERIARELQAASQRYEELVLAV